MLLVVLRVVPSEYIHSFDRLFTKTSKVPCLSEGSGDSSVNHPKILVLLEFMFYWKEVSEACGRLRDCCEKAWRCAGAGESGRGLTASQHPRLPGVQTRNPGALTSAIPPCLQPSARPCLFPWLPPLPWPRLPPLPL